MQSVLFVISIYNYHREVFPVVSCFCKRGEDVKILIGWTGPTSEAAIIEYQELGCDVHLVPSEFAYLDLPIAHTSDKEVAEQLPIARNVNVREVVDVSIAFKRAYQICRRVAVRSNLLRRSVGAAQRFNSMRKIRKYAKDLLTEIRPKCVFQGPFHSIGQFDNAIYTEAKISEIKRFCYPVSAYHGRDNVQNARYGNIRAGMLSEKLWCDFDLWNRVFAFLFPKWVNGFARRNFFYEDPFVLLAARLSGTMLDDLWQKPQPTFDMIYVFSPFSASLLDDGSFPMHKVSICGIPLLDEVIRSLTEVERTVEVYSHLGLRNGDQFLLYNVEPSFEHHYSTPKEHWRNFEKMMEVVTSFGLPVVLSLHPLCKEENYKFAKEKFGVSISTQFKIHTLYPLAALVVSFPCSTNIMAELFDKRLVVYDLFGLASKENGREKEFRLPYANIGASFESVSLLLRDQISLLGASGSSSGNFVESDACERIYEHSMELCGSSCKR